MKQGGLKKLADKNIGQGAFGTAMRKVYEIEQIDVSPPNFEVNVGKKVCFVKKIFAGINDLQGSPFYSAIDNIRREISLMIELNQQQEPERANIVKLYSWGDDPGRRHTEKIPYLIMDYFNGGDLKEMIKSKELVVNEDCYQDLGLDATDYIISRLRGDGAEQTQLNFGWKAEDTIGAVLRGGGRRFKADRNPDRNPSLLESVIINIFKGIQFLHTKSVIHCDIKPENIFLNMTPANAPVIVIGDLGLAVSERRQRNSFESSSLSDGFYSEMRSLPQPGGTRGTFSYLPIEAVRMKKPLFSQDYYAFGVVTLEVLLLWPWNPPVVSRRTAEAAQQACTRHHETLLSKIKENESALGEFGEPLKKLLSSPSDITHLTQIRRGAFEEIGRIAKSRPLSTRTA